MPGVVSGKAAKHVKAYQASGLRAHVHNDLNDSKREKKSNFSCTCICKRIALLKNLQDRDQELVNMKNMSFLAVCVTLPARQDHEQYAIYDPLSAFNLADKYMTFGIKNIPFNLKVVSFSPHYRSGHV